MRRDRAAQRRGGGTVPVQASYAGEPPVEVAQFGPRFYGLPPNEERITLARQDWRSPERLPFGAEELIPLRAGETIPWKLV